MSHYTDFQDLCRALRRDINNDEHLSMYLRNTSRVLREIKEKGAF